MINQSSDPKAARGMSIVHFQKYGAAAQKLFQNRFSVARAFNQCSRRCRTWNLALQYQLLSDCIRRILRRIDRDARMPEALDDLLMLLTSDDAGQRTRARRKYEPFEQPIQPAPCGLDHLVRHVAAIDRLDENVDRLILLCRAV